jgi:hypothetical protein
LASKSTTTQRVCLSALAPLCSLAFRALVERTFVQSPSDGTGSKGRVAELFIDHARNLKEAEAAIEKLDRELGDF